MQSMGLRQAVSEFSGLGDTPMQTPEDIAAMLRLNQLGWGAKRIAREMGISRNTVRRYLQAGGPIAYRQPRRTRALAGLDEWLTERFLRHRGNADVVRQELAAERGVVVCLRTVERAVRPLRRQLAAEARATVRFETPPGQQLQIDFGEIGVLIAGQRQRVHLFVATLGYSRRLYTDAFDNESQAAWLAGIEAAFRHFGGTPRELLVDNARALVSVHDTKTRTVRLNERFEAFCRYWGVAARACQPRRARTKGKDERGVGYVKGNAIAGRHFESYPALRAHLARWTREVADMHIHGTTREPPAQRFEAGERALLTPIAQRAPFLQQRQLVRRVHSDACIEVDTSRYSVPWRLIGETVSAVVSEAEVRIEHAGAVVARHAASAARGASVIDRAHLLGVVGAAARSAPSDPAPAALQRPLTEYEQAAGGAW